MKCLDCGGGLEYVQDVRFARCSHCVALFTVKEDVSHRRWLEPLEVRGQDGRVDRDLTAKHAQQLGFAPRKASHSVAKLGGVNVVVNTGRIERDLRNKVSGWIWGLVIGAIMLLVLAGFFGWVIWTAKRASTATAEAADPKNAKAVAWDGTSPYKCGGADNVSIENVIAKLASGTAITAAGSCQLWLVNVDITAPVVVEASANATVTFKGGAVKGGKHAAVATGNAKVDFQGTTVRGATRQAGNGKVTGAR